MPLSDLVAIVPPPANPLEAKPSARRKVESSLKIELPDTYIEYATTYGSGLFLSTQDSLHIYNPLARNYLKCVRDQLKTFREYRQDEGPEAFEFHVYPKKPGVLPIGSNDAYALFFLVDGEPESWPIVVQPLDDSEFYRHDLSLPEFLLQLFKAEKRTAPWPNGWYENAKEFRFAPSELEWDEPKEYRNLYQLYVKNGNKADFWAVSDIMLANYVIFHVTSVGGKANGPIAGSPPDYGHVPIAADVYRGQILDAHGAALDSGEKLGEEYWSVPAPEWYIGPK